MVHVVYRAVVGKHGPSKFKLSGVQVGPEMFYRFRHRQQFSVGDAATPFGWSQCLAIICDNSLFAFFYLGENRHNSYSTCFCVENVWLLGVRVS